jgi:cytochrome c oxidase subunit 4
LVVLFFMHVKYSPRLTATVILGGLFWLVILLALTFSDFATRGWLPVPALGAAGAP